MQENLDDIGRLKINSDYIVALVGAQQGLPVINKITDESGSQKCKISKIDYSEADAGIAISTGAAIAREIADITVASEDLFELVTLRKLSEALMARIHGSYRFIVAFNLSLITLGVAGVLPPAISALLHNTSTLGIGLKNMTDLLEEHEGA